MEFLQGGRNQLISFHHQESTMKTRNCYRSGGVRYGGVLKNQYVLWSLLASKRFMAALLYGRYAAFIFICIHIHIMYHVGIIFC